MSKSINTLISDMEDVLSHPEKYDLSDAKEFGGLLGETLSSRLNERKGKGSLRLSQIGNKCDRKSWFQVNSPEKEEPLLAKTRMKFLYGDVLEDLILYLAKASGHTVECEQLEVEINGVTGHIDAIIDGILVDIKSVNSRSAAKFRDHKLETDDPFGYIEQLNSYLAALQNRPELKVKGSFAFLVADKELGGFFLDLYKANSFLDTIKRVQHKKDVTSQKELPPRGYKDKVEANGNKRLCMECSYCGFKDICVNNLRTFLYSTGPVFLTDVVKEPNVKEVT